jgi:cysteine-rich repeat protein
LCEEVSTDPAAKIRTLVACFDEATCGDRDLDTGESCDDGNRVDGDGCDAACRIELI